MTALDLFLPFKFGLTTGRDAPQDRSFTVRAANGFARSNAFVLPVL
jgi:hypothetical protein